MQDEFRLAVVTTPEDWSAAGPLRTPTQTLLAALRRARPDAGALTAVFESGRELAGGIGARELRPRSFEQILFLVDDSPMHAFMVPLVRAIGGAVWQPRWELPLLARSAYPELSRPGWRGRLRALREGGLAAARTWRADTDTGPALNRSLVRHGDAFLVADARLAERIATDRNAPTPTAVIDAGADDAGLRCLALLRNFPAPRAARRSLIMARVREAERMRAAAKR